MSGSTGLETAATVDLTIDGRRVSVHRGSTILAAARELGIDIPTLCHDERLTPAAACRLCVVEVVGNPALVPACATEAAPGMVLFTESSAVVEARRTILDLLLSDHPLDCLTCEQAGECRLQQYCYRYGIQASSFDGERRELPIDSENDLLERDMNKCILCGKCVRVCQEVQVTNAIDFAGRGFQTRVSSSFGRPLDISFCRLCGQCIDVCPTGALTNKQLKGVRPWERTEVRTTCPFCGVGCTFNLNVAGGKVIGVSAAPDGAVNRGALCVKGRYHTDIIESPDRVATPLIKRDGAFEQATWDEALDLAARRLLEIKARHGADALGVLSSARCTNEENYLLQRLTRAGLNTNSIDHCART